MAFATKNAVLKSVRCEPDAQSMNRWVERILSEYGSFIRCPKYQSVFRCSDLKDRPVCIGAAGRLVGMRVSVSHREIKGELDVRGEVFYTVCNAPAAGFSTVPFGAVFALCNALYRKLQESIAPEFYAVPLMGGLKTLFLSDEEQEMVNYYLPEAELFGVDGQYRLFTADGVPEALPLPGPAGKEGWSYCPICSEVQYPEKEDYLRRMEKVLRELNSDRMKKVVVSRKDTLVPAGSFDRLDYASYLYNGYFQEYFYLFRQGEDAYWTGISPEIIMKQSGSAAVTKPLAGTRKKYDDEELNKKVYRELTTTSKDINEHEHALYFMVEQLKNARIGEITIDKNKVVLETPYAFHIKSEISMRLHEHVTCFDVIGALYPPATIWGIPVDKTELLLKETEPFDREFFSGFYGYWNYEGEGNAALLIRSAKLERGAVSLYAGGGIVKDSDPEAEFDETVNKMRPLRSYFRD